MGTNTLTFLQPMLTSFYFLPLLPYHGNATVGASSARAVAGVVVQANIEHPI